MKKLITLVLILGIITMVGLAQEEAEKPKPKVEKPVEYKLLTSQADNIRKLVRDFQSALQGMLQLYEAELKEVGRIPRDQRVSFIIDRMVFVPVKNPPPKKGEKK